jgi:16S rRNA U516 pseudouridylate synthase RsuA-like enzyme
MCVVMALLRGPVTGSPQRWELIAEAKAAPPGQADSAHQLFYMKYNKPRGVTCTSDLSDPDNLVVAGGFADLPQRVFSVGRLDKDSTGLLIVTSDGRLCDALLRPKLGKRKRYIVQLDQEVSDVHIAALANGVIITTIAQVKIGPSLTSAVTSAQACRRKRQEAGF